jgi:hypothetical protein
LGLSSETLVSKFAAFKFDLYRYIKGAIIIGVSALKGKDSAKREAMFNKFNVTGIDMVGGGVRLLNSMNLP